MRLVGCLPTEADAKKFSEYLSKNNIQHTVEMQMDTIHQKFSYAIWIHEEDQIEKALNFFESFQKAPEDPKFSFEIMDFAPGSQAEKEKEEKKKKGFFSYKLTIFFILLCSFVYFLNFFQEIQIIHEERHPTPVLFTPIQLLLFFDAPDTLKGFNEVFKEFAYDSKKPLSEQSEALQKELQSLNELPMWHGFYHSLVEKWQKPKDPLDLKGPLFEKIKKGQIWRVLSPCFLHVNFFHILFNMLWLWILGRQLEERLSKINYILLVAIVGIFSNLVQYLVSGPLFLGFSGVILGMVGYIYAREKIAPWEGFPLPRMTILFLTFYVVVMLFLSFFSFFFEVFNVPYFSVNIGNSAHISGAIIGLLLGRFPILIGRRH